MTTIINLPLPPSTNNLFRNWTDAEKARGRHLQPNGKQKKGRPKSERYCSWLNAAGWELKLQKPKPVKGRVHITITLSERSRLDLGNCEKAVVDLLVEHRIIEGDSKAFVRGITLLWGAVEGVRVSVQPIKAIESQSLAA